MPDMMNMKEGESTESGDEPVSVFIPAEALMGKSVKVGDTLTMDVKDINSETGEVEAVCRYSNSGDKKPSYEEGFDKAMPAESE